MRRSHQRDLCPVAAKRKAWNLDVERMSSLRGPRVRLQGSLPTVFIRLCRSMWDGDLVHAVRAVSTRLAACYTQHCRFQNFYPYQRGTRFRGVQTIAPLISKDRLLPSPTLRVEARICTVGGDCAGGKSACLKAGVTCTVCFWPQLSARAGTKHEQIPVPG